MYVLNAEDLASVKWVSVKIGKYIEKKYLIYAIHKDKKKYIFTTNEELEDIIKKIPFWVKFG